MSAGLIDVRTTKVNIKSYTPDRPMPMVKFFAVMGVIIAAVFADTLIRWVLSPDFKPAPVGTDPIPPVTLLLVHITDIFCGAVSLAALWFVVIRPWACPSREVPIPSRYSLAVPPDDHRLSASARQN